MSGGVSDGQVANEATFDSAYMFSNDDTGTIGKVNLNNTADVNSGVQILNTQRKINEIADSDGTNGEGDANRKVYSSTNYVANGDNRKVAIGKLDTQLKTTQTDLDADEVVIANHESRINTIENLASTFNGDKQFTGNVVFQGDVTVNGIQTIVNSTDLQVADKNILVNKGGNDASAEEAGLDVQRTSVNGGIRFDSTLSSKWKLGLVGAFYEILVSGIAQTIAGIKSFSSGIKTDTIDEVTLNAGVTVDSVLLKDGLVSGRNVATDGTVQDAHIANVSNPHAVTKAQVGLTNVTDDAQLKRSANDFSSFTEKTSLAADDVFIIEDSAAAGVKKYVKKSNLGASGSGGGSINLITNGDAENAVSSIFTPYADAAGTRPVDGTGGSPTVTTSVTTTNPLTLTKSYLLTKPASNTQGQGWSVLTSALDKSYRGKPVKVGADLIVNSGTFVAGANGSSPVDGDAIITFYDITNSKIVEPSNIKVFSNSSTVSFNYESTIQFDTNCAAFRMIVHCASTSALAYELMVDNVTVSPSVYVFGSPVTDWQSYVPTFTGFGTVTLAEAFWRRVGDSIQIRGRGTLGTTTAVAAKVSFPSGYIVDPLKSTIQSVHGGELLNNSTSTQFTVLVAPSDTGILFSANNLSSSLGTAIGSSGAAVGWDSGLIPIQGLSSSVQMSDSADTRIVDFVGTGTGSTQSLTANVTDILLTTSKDSHAAWTGSAYRITSAGDYTVSGFLYSATSNFAVLPYINAASSNKYLLASATNLGGGGSVILTNLKAGDLITFRANTSVTLPADTAQNISISKLSGTSAIAATEEISCRYINNAGTSIANTGDNNVPFATRDFDSHFSFNGTVFTCVAAGRFEAKASLNFASAAYVAGNRAIASVYKNGSYYTYGPFSSVAAAATFELGCFVDTVINCVAGDTIEFRANNNRTAGATSLNTTSSSNHMTIKRIK